MRIRSASFALTFAGCSAALFGSAANAAPNPQFRLCVLDRARIVQQSRLAQNMGQRFQQVRQQQQAKLENDRRTLDADARALEKLRASLPPAVVKTQEAKIARRQADLKTRADKINQELAQLDDQLTVNVAKLSDPTVRSVEAERGCSMLIARTTLIHLDDLSLDITAAVVARMNALPTPESQTGR